MNAVGKEGDVMGNKDGMAQAELLRNGLREGIDGVKASMGIFAKTLTETLEPALKELGQAAVAFYNVMWDTYLEHGAIYGETNEGMMQWYEEQGKAAQQHQKENNERAWAECLASIEKKVADEQ